MNRKFSLQTYKYIKLFNIKLILYFNFINKAKISKY